MNASPSFAPMCRYNARAGGSQALLFIIDAVIAHRLRDDLRYCYALILLRQSNRCAAFCAIKRYIMIYARATARGAAEETQVIVRRQ